jgi:hypothetical protein
VRATIQSKLADRKRRIDRRLDKTKLGDCQQPMFTAHNIHYEIGDRTRGLAPAASALFMLWPGGSA